MVNSQINKQLIYEEDSNIEKKDYDFASLKYPIEIAFDEDHDVKFYITFGRKNEKFLKGYNIIYYPIYLIVGSVVLSKIGVLELEADKTSKIVDEDGNIDPEKMDEEPLFFSFLTEAYLSNKNAIVTSDNSDTESEGKNSDVESVSSVESTDFSKSKKEKESEENIFNIPENKLNKRTNETQKSDESLLFKTDTSVKTPNSLIEETKTMADKLKSEFTESSRNEWIEIFMKNNQYGIQDNEGGGDCFFAVIRDAFQEIGKMTTIEKLREILSEEANDEIFQQYRGVYLAMEDGIVENDKEIINIQNMIKEYKRRIRSTSQVLTKTEHEDIVQQAKKATKRLENLKKENQENAEFLRYNFGFMKHIDSLEAFQEYIKTSKYWADTWAISTLEYKLNIKLVIFSEEAFRDGSLDSVLNCGEMSAVLQKQGKFVPDYYIMTSYSGIHYKLVTYKKRKIFDFAEIPYDVKVLILNKCMERNSGIFYLIQDFRNLKSKIGLSPDEGKPADDNEDENDDAYLAALYDPNIVFVLDAHAPILKEPGTTAQGEKIPRDKKRDFMKLSKIKAWRRKLHDSWTEAPFTLDGKTWASVEHYYQGSKFRKQHPDFYSKFSLDSKDSEFNKDVAEAKVAGRKSKNKYRSPNISIDPDFYDGERSHQERQIALKSKFEQNMDLKEVLLLTQSAKLVNFVRQAPVEIDADLMNLRITFQE